MSVDHASEGVLLVRPYGRDPLRLHGDSIIGVRSISSSQIDQFAIGSESARVAVSIDITPPPSGRILSQSLASRRSTRRP